MAHSRKSLHADTYSVSLKDTLNDFMTFKQNNVIYNTLVSSATFCVPGQLLRIISWHLL